MLGRTQWRVIGNGLSCGRCRGRLRGNRIGCRLPEAHVGNGRTSALEALGPPVVTISKFKWYSERWSRSYDHLRRPNTWGPGDPEDPYGPQDVHPQGFRMPAERTSTNPRRMDSRQAERDHDTHIEGFFHSDTRSATEPICARCNDPAPASCADGQGHICEER